MPLVARDRECEFGAIFRDSGSLSLSFSSNIKLPTFAAFFRIHGDAIISNYNDNQQGH